jgi:putative endonuclease
MVTLYPKYGKMAKHNELGAWGEALAADYLQGKGYTIVERDWHSGHRDLDIIAMDGETVVFVEVKTRHNRVFGEPEEAVDYQKLRNLRAAINHYVKLHRLWQEIRLDVVTVVGTPESGTPEICHLQDIPMY